MDIQSIKSKVILYSRIRLEQKRKEYYEFTETELDELIQTVIEECIAVADANHQQYVTFAESLANLTLPSTSDLIRQRFDIQ